MPETLRDLVDKRLVYSDKAKDIGIMLRSTIAAIRDLADELDARERHRKVREAGDRQP